MKIDKVIERENGTVQFTGELSAEELAVVLEAGLAILLRMGVISTLKTGETGEAREQPPVALN